MIELEDEDAVEDGNEDEGQEKRYLDPWLSQGPQRGAGTSEGAGYGCVGGTVCP